MELLASRFRHIICSKLVNTPSTLPCGVSVTDSLCMDEIAFFVLLHNKNFRLRQKEGFVSIPRFIQCCDDVNYLQAVCNVPPNFPRQLLSLILCVLVGPGTEEDHEKHAEQEAMNSFGFLNGTTSGNYMLHCFLSFARAVYWIRYCSIATCCCICTPVRCQPYCIAAYSNLYIFLFILYERQSVIILLLEELSCV